jgi:ABC-type Mn2+/Zn2+ transport system permease subunit
MDATWPERLSLFRYALAASLLAGLVCPLLGALLHLRRTSFWGITLPQFAAAGVVFGFVLLPWWIAHVGLGGLTLDAALSDTHAALNYHLLWAALFVFGGLFSLLWAGRGGGSEIGRVAAAFALANAATYVFGRMSPVGRAFVDELLLGEVLGVGFHELETVAVVFGLVLAAFLWLRRDLVLAAFDREFARVSGHRVVGLDVLLNVLTGSTVAVGTIALGPTLLFGLLVVPPLAARAWARSMRSYLALSAAFGLASTALGIAAAFELDLPLGAAIVSAAGILLLPGLLLRRRVASP